MKKSLRTERRCVIPHGQSHHYCSRVDRLDENVQQHAELQHTHCIQSHFPHAGSPRGSFVCCVKLYRLLLNLQYPEKTNGPKHELIFIAHTPVMKFIGQPIVRMSSILHIGLLYCLGHSPPFCFCTIYPTVRKFYY